MDYTVTGAAGYRDSPDGYRPDVNDKCGSAADVQATYNTLLAKLKGCLNYGATEALLQQAQGESADDNVRCATYTGPDNSHCPWGVDDANCVRQWNADDKGRCSCPCASAEEEEEQTSLAQLNDNSTQSDALLNLLADAVVQRTETKVRL